MRAEIIARNYADTLLALADRHGGAAAVEPFGRALDELAALLRSDARIREFLETPRVSAAQKQAALRGALAGRVPDLFLRFVMVVVEKRRQALLPDIADAYRDLVDERMGRVRVSIAISHEPDAALREEIRRGLEARLGKTVVPAYRVDPSLLGGLVVRVGDEVLDGSVRARAARMRRRMLEAALPAEAAA